MSKGQPETTTQPEMTAQEVAARLGVKLDTVYAYASRGVLHVRRRPGSRQSLFDPDEVELLARRGRPRRSTRPAVLDLVVETGLTTIDDHRVRYRGRDACRMARSHSFEQTARWLWIGQDPSSGQDPSAVPWEAYPVHVPDLPRVRDRIRAAVAVSAAGEPFLADLDTHVVVATAESLIATMVSAVPAQPGTRTARLVLGRQPPIRGSIAGRLWGRLSPARPAPGLVATLNAALVLLADHELAASTFAARIAASARADPFSVVLAGLGPMAGPLHGGASSLAHRMLADAIARGPQAALAAALEERGHLPGFGHPLYPDGDPRARLLLGMLRSSDAAAPYAVAARDLVDAARRHSGREPNVDFALAVLSTAARMPPTAGETIFTVARTAGWIAHAIEEYAAPPLRFRARAVARQPG